MRNDVTNHCYLRPCLKEILRTCVYPSSLLLRIEKLVFQEVSAEQVRPLGEHDGRRKARSSLRMYLTDGELVIQALLASTIDLRSDANDLREGALLETSSFQVRSAKRLNGEGKVVYLAINECELVDADIESDSDEGGGFIRERPNERERKSPKRNYLQAMSLEATDEEPNDLANTPKRFKRAAVSDKSSEMLECLEDDEGFEPVTRDPTTIKWRRQSLRALLLTPTCSTPSGQTEHAVELKGSRLPTGSCPTQDSAVHGRSSNIVATTTGENRAGQAPNVSSAPLHTLASLLKSDLPKRNYACSVLAVVSWVSTSLIWKPQSPFPAKRHIKLHDQSIADRQAGITLAVYVNAKNFEPVNGTVALFRGIVRQTWQGEVILNAYQSLEDSSEPWYIEDLNQLEGMSSQAYDLKKWWNERCSKRSASLTK